MQLCIFYGADTCFHLFCANNPYIPYHPYFFSFHRKNIERKWRFYVLFAPLGTGNCG